MEQDEHGRRQHFAAVLSQARIARDMTQEALAKAIGCNVRSIRIWEAGRGSPGWEYIRKMSLTLGLSGDQLLLLESVSDAESLPPLAWEAARQELLEVEELMRETTKHLTRATNVLGKPHDAPERSTGTGARSAARRRRERGQPTADVD